jgi:osmoprotectant transport system permease protein
MKREVAEKDRFSPDRDRVVIAGSLLIILALTFLPFLVVRATRISPPAGLSFFAAVGPVPLFGIAALVTASVFSSFRKDSRWRTATSAWLSRMLVILILWQAGVASSRLLGPDIPFARISLGSGAWLSLLGAFTVMSSCRSAAKSDRVFVVFCWGFYAALLLLIISGELDSLSFMVEYSNRSARFWKEISRHITLSLSAVTLGLMLGFPLGVTAFRRDQLRAVILSSANTLQTIPSLAMFGLMIAPLAWAARSFPFLASMGVGGIGWTPALIALTVYSLLPIIRNTISAFSMIDPSITESGLGIGMSRGQLFYRVELPIAMPVILTGVRISGVQAIGNTAVAALIGAGGLGQFIFQGLGEAAPDLILLGAIPTVALALAADSILKRLTEKLRPGGNP